MPLRIDMSKWKVVEHEGYWIGVILSETPMHCKYCEPPRYVAIMPSSFPWELAVDALLDFMDRLRTFRVPAGVDSPRALMDICVSAARRQR